MSKLSGSCLCGSVKYETDADPQMLAICHCSHCQKATGSAFSMNLGVPGDSVHMSGKPTVYEDVGTSGQPVLRMFCGNCGSAIATDAKAFPGVLFLKAGTLDDVSGLKPNLEIWTDSAQPWVTLCTETQKFPANPG
jgi:hypothetical protein